MYAINPYFFLVFYTMLNLFQMFSLLKMAEYYLFHFLTFTRIVGNLKLSCILFLVHYITIIEICTNISNSRKKLYTRTLLV